MSRPVILVDCDGVLLDFNTPAYEVVEEVTKVYIPLDERVRWDICGDPRIAEHRNEIERRWRLDDFARRIKPYPRAPEAIKALRMRNSVFALTAHMRGSETWVHIRDELLIREFGFEHKEIIHTHAKHMVRGDVFIDDKPAHIEHWQSTYPQSVAILWDQPYNRDSWVRLRARKWDDVQTVMSMMKHA